MKHLLYILLLLPVLSFGQQTQPAGGAGNATTNNLWNGLVNGKIAVKTGTDTAKVRALWAKFPVHSCDTGCLVVQNGYLFYFDGANFVTPAAATNGISLAQLNDSLVKYLRKVDSNIYVTPTTLADSAVLFEHVANKVTSMTSPSPNSTNYPTTSAVNGALASYTTAVRFLDSMAAHWAVIQGKVNYTDTAAMLANYAKIAALAAYVKYTDTSAMLANIYTMLGQKVKYADTSAMLANIYTGLGLRVKYSDTAAMLANIYSSLATKGTGTVTSITNDYGTTGGTITTAGSIGVDSALLATKLLLQKKVDSLNTLIASKQPTGNYWTYGDTTTLSTKGYRQKGIDSINATKQAIGSYWTYSDTGTLSTKAYRQKAVDSLNVLISGKQPTGNYWQYSDTATLSTKAYRQKLADSLNPIIAGKQASGNYWTYSDTTTLSTKAYRQKLADSLNPIIAGKQASGSYWVYSDTVSTLGTKAWRQKGIDSIALNFTPLSTFNSQSGTTYTLVASDKGKVVCFSNSSAITLTVPSGLGATFYCTIQQNGTGNITPTASSTTLHIQGGYTKSKDQYGMFSIIFSPTTDTYNIQGNMQ